MNRAPLVFCLLLTPRLALRNLFRNLRRTLLTVLLISLSLALLMFTDALMRGLLQLMVATSTEVLSGEAQTHRRGFLDTLDVALYMPDTAPLEQRLAASTQVTAFSVRTISGGLLAGQRDMSGGVIYGVDAAREAAVSRLESALVDGAWLTGRATELLMGEPLAEKLEARLGDRIVITQAAANGELSQHLFRISGIFRFGLRELDENLVFINLETARAALGIPGGGHEIAISLARPATDGSHLPLFDALSDDDILTQSWSGFNPEIAALVGWVDISTLLTGGVLFLLATFGIINSLFMSIHERIHEFGVVKALGTEPWQLFMLIIAEALLLALVSVLLGLGAGTLAIRYFGKAGLYFGEMEFEGILATHIFPEAALSQFTTFPVYVILLTLVVSIYPALHAARLVPAEALRRSL